MKMTRRMKLVAVAFLGFLLLPGYFLSKENQLKVDLITFSFDRPLQLYAFLESTEQYITGLGKTVVIYRSSNQAFHDAYEKVRSTFTWVEFLEQGAYPQGDFKPLTMKALNEASASYVIFAVDDIVIKDYVDLAECAKSLETTGAYGFYLRLGANLTQCYPYGSAKQPLPAFERIGSDMLTWILGRGVYDWGYPHTVDMTVYRKADVMKDFSSFPFTNPNILEGNWAMRAGRVAQRKGLCFAETKIVNLPLNRVQNVCLNPNMGSLSPQELLDLFNQGLKMDIQPLFKIKNLGAHTEYVPTFITR